ncbi:CDP-diacylglycerol--glycerol-3-phosphate 3-phosphatidyltransferase [Actinokineospora sp. NBRC 105648]|uniref:CDP-diacylglycerol--glycerol-3-phosphate 3-phosphatidyltransferase n=1 Tax=Actinokineospora sp. NBRC 105648 TaxID=3032206 RepID=UPI0024A4AA1D|nr:CDP-diacylglycerol--glycerol-3-phosphate 3-phosphatidyltransferase [Actinokineospora sp. NBRC 105648]GLZ40158.1 CDP-diacylglycerol--glycerol-3-phosphate 3-phosphatidyltransferase [Actinokineospora sp. NBRC 105648]
MSSAATGGPGETVGDEGCVPAPATGELPPVRAVPAQATAHPQAAVEPGHPVLPEPTEVPLLNVANLLTLSRLVLVPVFLAALFAGDGTDTTWRLIAFAVFAVASITDHVDGWLARKHGLITDFGKIVDPIADKALTGAALVGLSVLGELPWWITLVIAAREVGVTLLRFWVIRHGVIPASRGGKLKTLTQVFAIGLFLLPLPSWLTPFSWTMMGAAVVLTVVTGVDYVIRAIRLRARGLRAVPQ